MFSDTHEGAREDNRSLDDIKKAISELQQEHAAQGHSLSGRVIHVCHYLPVVCSFQEKRPLTPPRTPDAVRQSNLFANVENSASSVASTDEPSKWNLNPRSGHSAMISGIRSLGVLCEQTIVGWTGEILLEGSGQPVPFAILQEADRSRLEEAIQTHKEADETRPVKLHPVLLDDKVARGHYEGYCKNSAYSMSESVGLLSFDTIAS
jgi:trehalose 6-phosphate synthase/phosphatase